MTASERTQEAHSANTAEMRGWFVRLYGSHGFVSNGVKYPDQDAAAAAAREALAESDYWRGAELRSGSDSVKILRAA